jgi:L-glyceraldehyde 3-phosphate reductase
VVVCVAVTAQIMAAAELAVGCGISQLVRVLASPGGGADPRAMCWRTDLERLVPVGPTRFARPISASYSDPMEFRRVGRSGLRLPAISLGLWQNFGDDRSFESQRDVICRAVDLGVTHFDLANNYGPPPGAAERNLARVLGRDLRGHRDELVISTKAGYLMWDGPYGEGGSRKHVRASLDQSLARLGLDYVDIYYAHRFDDEAPLDETLGALDTAVRQGKALYVGVSSYSAAQTRDAAAILRGLGTPLLVHQPSYSILDRWIERENLLAVLEDEGAGCIVFSPLSQGLLSDRYLESVPRGSRASAGVTLTAEVRHPLLLDRVRALNAVAGRRGQSLAQMALAWTLRDPGVTAALTGVSSVAQLEANVVALEGPPFTEEELAEIDRQSTFT